MAIKIKVDYKLLRKEINSALFSKDMENLARNKSLELLKLEKEKLLESLDQDPVSIEIKGGPDFENISNTLGGYGNLFSFIGFPQGAEPVEELHQILHDGINLKRTPTKKIVTEKGARFQFEVQIPSKDEIAQQTPLPWEPGNSWAIGIERGISGLGYYLYSEYNSPIPSRSSTGIQIKNTVRNLQFRPRAYLSKLFNKFAKNLS
jgi:hypothetical protein